ncbi:MAG: hypothetical protein Q8L98_02130 [Chlamydiales bacterium]|nr:hypothetical protein [Chlamydiales bacterium]
MIGVASFFKAKNDLDFNVKNRGSMRFEALSRMVDLCRFKNISVQEFESIQPEKQFERIMEQFQRERIFTVERQTKIDQLRTKIAGLRAEAVRPKKEEKPVSRLSSQIRNAAISQTPESFTGKLNRFAVISCIALATITFAALTVATYQPDDSANTTYPDHGPSQDNSSSVCNNLAYLDPKSATCSPYPFCGPLKATPYVNRAYLNQKTPAPSKGFYVYGRTVLQAEGEEGRGLQEIANRLIVKGGSYVVNGSTVIIKEVVEKAPSIRPLLNSVCRNPRFCR